MDVLSVCYACVLITCKIQCGLVVAALYLVQLVAVYGHCSHGVSFAFAAPCATCRAPWLAYCVRAVFE